jgi:hypothetical protein
MGFIDRTKRILSQPEKFFSSVAKDRGYASPWTHYIIVVTIYMGVYFLTAIPGSVAELQAEAEVGATLSAIILLVIFAVMLVFILALFALTVFISAGVLHLFLMVVGARKGYIQTFKVVCYASTPMMLLGPFGLFDSVPIVGRLVITLVGLVLGIYVLVIEVVGVRVLHKISTGRAILGTVILPILLGIIFIVLLALVVFALLAAGLQSGITAQVINVF